MLEAVARRQIRVAASDFVRSQVDRIRRVAHGLHGSRDTRLHRRETLEQAADLVAATIRYALIQHAASDAFEVTARLFKRRDHSST
jgi:hypothetical protein